MIKVKLINIESKCPKCGKVGLSTFDNNNIKNINIKGVFWCYCKKCENIYSIKLI